MSAHCADLFIFGTRTENKIPIHGHSMCVWFLGWLCGGLLYVLSSRRLQAMDMASCNLFPHNLLTCVHTHTSETFLTQKFTKIIKGT